MADLSVDGERHGLLGGEEGQRAADESQQDDGEQTELERAAHNTSIGSQDPGRRTGAPSVDGPPVTRPPRTAVRPGARLQAGERRPGGLHPGCRSRHDNEHGPAGNCAQRVKQSRSGAESGRADTLCDCRAGRCGCYAWGSGASLRDQGHSMFAVVTGIPGVRRVGTAPGSAGQGRRVRPHRTQPGDQEGGHREPRRQRRQAPGDQGDGQQVTAPPTPGRSPRPRPAAAPRAGRARARWRRR